MGERKGIEREGEEEEGERQRQTERGTNRQMTTLANRRLSFACSSP